MQNLEVLSTRIAALLLLQKGEIAVPEIEALPFVDSRDMAVAIAAKLTLSFNTEWYQRRCSLGELGCWEDVIRLRAPTS